MLCECRNKWFRCWLVYRRPANVSLELVLSLSFYIFLYYLQFSYATDSLLLTVLLPCSFGCSIFPTFFFPFIFLLFVTNWLNNYSYVISFCFWSAYMFLWCIWLRLLFHLIPLGAHSWAASHTTLSSDSLVTKLIPIFIQYCWHIQSLMLI